jgi:hypothetical protein
MPTLMPYMLLLDDSAKTFSLPPKDWAQLGAIVGRITADDALAVQVWNEAIAATALPAEVKSRLTLPASDGLGPGLAKVFGAAEQMRIASQILAEPFRQDYQRWAEEIAVLRLGFFIGIGWY